MSEKRVVTISDPRTGKSAECPVLEGTHGRPVIDIREIARALGYFTHDPGYATTSACRSAITYIDGEKGELLYRGYPIEQLAEKSNYLEVCYLLLYGELPSWRAMGGVQCFHPAPHHGARGNPAFPVRIPVRRPPHGHAGRYRGCAVHLLPRFAPT